MSKLAQKQLCPPAKNNCVLKSYDQITSAECYGELCALIVADSIIWRRALLGRQLNLSQWTETISLFVCLPQPCTQNENVNVFCCCTPSVLILHVYMWMEETEYSNNAVPGDKEGKQNVWFVTVHPSPCSMCTQIDAEREIKEGNIILAACQFCPGCVHSIIFVCKCNHL